MEVKKTVAFGLPRGAGKEAIVPPSWDIPENRNNPIGGRYMTLSVMADIATLVMFAYAICKGTVALLKKVSRLFAADDSQG